ncbi:TPA: hypothetical protein ACSH5C_000433 [Legionella pneumophila]|nr:hypothetical protein [Legionella pneumophila]
MAGNRKISKLEDMAFDALVKQGIFSIEVPASIDPINVTSVIEQKTHTRLMPVFLQAVIDDNRKKIAELLEKNPELLLVKALKGMEIQSQHTWLIIDAENEDALSIAAKRKQIKMIELLLPYYDKLEQTEDVINAKREALSAWKAYEIQKNADGEDEIKIPKEYADYAQSLIDVFKDETFPKGVPGENGVPLNVVLSDKTELALSALLNILVPKTAVKLDEHIDEELLLLAIFKAYVKNFLAFYYDWNKLDTLCIRLMGLNQSALTPETGEIWCESLDDVVTAIQDRKEKEISPRAASHKLKGGEDLYRASRDSRFGAGFDFLCGILGARARYVTAGVFEKTMSSKSNKFLEVLLRSSCCDNETITQQMTSGPTV